MSIQTKTEINNIQSMSYRDQMSSLMISFERINLSVTTYPQLATSVNLLGSTATVGITLTTGTGDRTEIIYIETRIVDHITIFGDEDYIYNIKLKDVGIHIGDDDYEIDDLLGQVAHVKLHLKTNKEEEKD